MLDDFFTLNKCDNLKSFSSATDFLQHFDNARSLQHAELPLAVHVQERSFKKAEFKNVRLSHATFERVTFDHCIFEDCLLVGTRFTDCEFHKCKFVNCNTYKISLKDVYIDPRSFHLHKTYRNSSPNIGVYLFQKLFQNAEETHQSFFASFADVQRRRWRRYQLRYELKAKNAPPWITAWQIASDLMFDAIAKYGYGPTRFLALSAIVFLVIAFLVQVLWSAMGMMLGGTPIATVTFLDSIYYCMLLITTLGFSEIIPATPIGKAFAVGCALFGLSWMGLFTAILVRRVIR